MKILVTGATGLLGSELTHQLVGQGAHVRILRRATSDLTLLGDVAEAVEHALGDVTDAASVDAAMDGVRQVYHTAAFLGFGGKRDREQLHAVNVGGTANVVNAALRAGAERLVLTSSIAAFGRTADESVVIDETAEWQHSALNTEYARSKYEAELEGYRGLAEGLDVVVVNPSLIFGVARPGENTRKIAEQIRDGKLPAIPVGGTNVVDVRDVATGHLLAMQHGKTGERYCLAGENLTWRTIIETLAEAFGVAPPRLTLAPGPAKVAAVFFEGFGRLTGTRPLITRETVRTSARFFRYSHRKAVDELGCHFRPFQETARDLAQALGR